MTLVVVAAALVSGCASSTKVPVEATRVDVWVDAWTSHDEAGDTLGVRLAETRGAAEAARRGAVDRLQNNGFTVASSRVTSAALVLDSEVAALTFECRASDEAPPAEPCAPPFYVAPEFADHPERSAALAELYRSLLTLAPEARRVTVPPVLVDLAEGDAVLVLLMRGHKVGFLKQVGQALTSAAVTDALLGVGVASWNTSAMAWAAYLVRVDDGEVLWRQTLAARYEPYKFNFKAVAQMVTTTLVPGPVVR